MAPLLERDAELERVEAALAAAREGHGALILIHGQAGIGKTALVAATRRRAERAGFNVAFARGSELEQELAFGIVRQLFEPFLADGRSESRPFAGAAELSRPLFQPEALTEAAFEIAPAPDLTFSFLHGLYWLSANLAQETPLLLAVDDAHWADRGSLRFLAYLGQRLEGMPVALLVAFRPAEAPAADDFLARLERETLAWKVAPEPLSADAVAALIAAATNRAPDPEFAEACRHATGGVPLLARELIQTLLEQGIDPVATSAGKVEEVGPRTVARYVVARARRLGPDAEQIARAVAVLGSDAELHRLARLAQVEDRSRVSAALDALTLAGILAPTRPVEFVHPVVRAAIYAEVQPGERSSIHARAADLLEQEHAADDRVAAHLLAAAPAGDQHVVEVLRRAAHTASTRGAPASAATYLERALAEPPDPRARLSVLHDLGAALVHSGQPSSAAHHLREAHRLATPGAERAAVAQALAGCLRLQWDHREAAAVIAEALPTLGAADEDVALGLRAELILIDALEPSSATAPPQRDAIPAGQRSSSLGGAKYLAALATDAAIRLRGSAAKTLELGSRARDAGIVADLAHGGSLWINTVAPLIIADGFELAELMVAEALEDAERRASLVSTSRALVVRSLLRLRQGNLSEAQADAEAALEATRDSGFYFTLLSVSVLVDANCELRDFDAGESLLEQSGLGDEIPDTFVHNWVLQSRGRLRLDQGRIEESVADLDELSLRIERRGQSNPAVFPHRSARALALLRDGDSDAAGNLAAEELSVARRWGAPTAVGNAMRVLGLCEGGNEGIALLRESAETLDGTSARLALAHSLVDLGAALRRAGDRSEAREPLRAAMELGHGCGAAPLVDRAREELLATGARPRRIMRVGVEALTPSELRVARMAAEGLTNREIAQALFITQRTVEGHLTHAFQKLEIGSRGELSSHLAG